MEAETPRPISMSSMCMGGAEISVVKAHGPPIGVSDIEATILAMLKRSRTPYLYDLRSCPTVPMSLVVPVGNLLHSHSDNLLKVVVASSFVCDSEFTIAFLRLVFSIFPPRAPYVVTNSYAEAVSFIVEELSSASGTPPESRKSE